MTQFSLAGHYGPEAMLDPSGDLLKNTPVTIANAGVVSLATLYSDKSKNTTIPNPTHTDTLGNLSFYAVPGDYDLLLSGTTVPVRITVEPDPSEIGIEGSLDETWVYSVPGPLAVNAGRPRMYAEDSLTILSIRASVGLWPIGDTVIVDVNKNGSTIFPVQSLRPTISTGENTDVATPGITVLDPGDYLTIDVDNIGSSVSGADLTVSLRLSLRA